MTSSQVLTPMKTRDSSIKALSNKAQRIMKSSGCDTGKGTSASCVRAGMTRAQGQEEAQKEGKGSGHSGRVWLFW